MSEERRLELADWLEDFAGDVGTSNGNTLVEAAEMLRQKSEWQPIETAPKDGSSILVALKGGEVREAEWFVRWYNDPSKPGWMPANMDEEYGHYVEPTHWMPLPKPPQTVDETGGLAIF